jgi:hypothetical protein
MGFAEPSAGPNSSESSSKMMVGGGAASVSTSGEVEAVDASGNSQPSRGPSVRTNIDSSQSGIAPVSMDAGRSAPVANAEEGGSRKTIMVIVLIAAAGVGAMAYFM